MPLLSIIIPTFNSSAVIEKALRSILEQSFSDWEILVMDGASKDNTVAIAESLADSRIRVYSEPDKGIYDAMNKGIVRSKGTWLYFLGSDDYLLQPNVLSLVFAQSYDEDVLYCEVESPHLKEANTGEWSIDNLEHNRCHQGILYRRSVFDRLGYYDLKYRVCADHALNIKWFLDDTFRSRHLPIKMAYFSEGGCSTAVQDLRFEHDKKYLILHHGRNKLTIDQKIKLSQGAAVDNLLDRRRYWCFVALSYCYRLVRRLGKR